MRCEAIERHRGLYPLVMMCRLLAVRRSTYYAWRRRPESRRTKEDRRLVMEIELSHKASDRTYGSPRVHEDLQERGIPCGRNRVARLMRERGIRAKQARRYKATTDSDHSHPVAANLLDRQFDVDEPDRVAHGADFIAALARSRQARRKEGSPVVWVGRGWSEPALHSSSAQRRWATCWAESWLQWPYSWRAPTSASRR